MIVVGAGPTGLWLASELALAGVDVVVVERASERSPYSKAMGMHPRTLEVFAMRGAEGPFLAAGRPIDSWHWGMLGSRLDFRGLDTPFPFMLAIPQARTEELLEERARALGVTILRGSGVTGLSQTDNGVTVDVGGRQMSAAYVVGADGAGSVVRKAAGIEFAGTDATVFGFVADVRLESPPPPGFAQVTSAGALLVAPAPGGLFRLGGYDPVDSGDVREFLRRAVGQDFGLGEIVWQSRFGNATRQAVSYRDGRVFLAGDAAHIHFPTGGVGLNTGVQDAMNLGWKLAAVLRGEATEELLDSYHAERHPVGAAVNADTQAQTALLTAITPEGLALRQAVGTLIAAPSEANRRIAERVTALNVWYPPADPEAHPLVGLRAPASAFPLLHAGKPAVIRMGTVEARVRPDGYIASVS